MTSRSGQTFHDPLVTDADVGLPHQFFDRFVVNLHRTDSVVPSIIVGAGLHPARDTVDGFAIVSTTDRQRNLRFAEPLSGGDWSSCGPFAWHIVEPNTTWHLQLAQNATGLAFDIVWQARTRPWWGDIDVTNSGGRTTRFQHLFQSGLCTGSLTLDGVTEQIDGWYSQRDRSRGVRTMTGGQGLHIWCQAQFPDRSIGFLFVEGRDGSRLLLAGAVMHVDGTIDEITDVAHDLVLDDLDLRSGRLLVHTVGGRTYDLAADAAAGGGFMAGGGYGGHHGTAGGRTYVETDEYPLDGSVTQRTLDSSLTDRLASFSWDGVGGSGIFEFALTRSRSYTYRPTL